MNKKLLVVTAIFALALAFVPALTVAMPSWTCNVRSWCGGLDGFWWQHLAASERATIVRTMIESAEFGYNWGTFDAVHSHLTAYQGAPTKSEDVFFKTLNSPVNAIAFSKSLPTYIAEIDDFYAKYPQKKPLKVIMVLYCLKDHPLYSCDVVGRSELLPWPTGP